MVNICLRLPFLVFLGLVCLSGCQPALESSEEAASWRLLSRDPAENGADPGRWPGWRGSNGSGIAAGGSPPIRLSDAEGFRWKVPVLGRGNSSPVVWDKYIVLTTALGEANLPTLAVLCFDRSDGKLLWQDEAGQARGETHVKNGYASSSAATDGKRIFVSLGATGLFCYDFSGNRLWRADLGDLQHIWGIASSPVLYGDTVIQLCDYDGDSYIAAFDKATGRRVWRTDRPSRGCWSTPVLVEVEAGGMRRTELVVNGTTHKPSGGGLVIAYDPADGRELWRVSGTTELVTPTPLVGGGLVFSTSGRNGPIIAVRPGGEGDVSDTRVVWKAARGGPYVPTGVCYRNRLFIVGDNGAALCLNAGSGEEIWRAKLPGVYTASLVAADGRIYAINEKGTVSVFGAADQFELLARSELNARCLATPAIVDGDLIVRTETDLYCFSGEPGEKTGVAGAERSEAPETPPLATVAAAERSEGAAPPTAHRPLPTSSAGPVESAATGSPEAPSDDRWPLLRGDPQATGVAPGDLPETLQRLWTFSADDRGGFEATAAIAEGVVVAGSTDKKLYAVNLSDGKKLWDFATPLGFAASAAIRDGQVYVGDVDGRFFCLDLKTGAKKWDCTTEGEIDSSANFYKDTVLFGSQDARLYCLKAATGELVWKFEIADQIRCFPTVVGDRGFVAGCDSRLHVVDLTIGKEVAAVDLDGPTGACPAIVGDCVFVGTESETFYGIDWRQAKVLWQYQNPDRKAPFRSSAAVTPQAVIVGSRDKLVHALDPANGRPLWTFSTKSRVDGSPVVVGSRVFVGSADGRIYGLDLKTGREVWRFEAGGAVLASPAVAAGRLVIGNDNGDLFCFGSKK